MVTRIRRLDVKKWILDIKSRGIIFFTILDIKKIDEKHNTSLYRGGQYLTKAHNIGYIRQHKKVGNIYKWEIII